jgi:hypothetical protein
LLEVLSQSAARSFSVREQVRQAKRQARSEQFDRVHQLHWNGELTLQIAKVLDLNSKPSRVISKRNFTRATFAHWNHGPASGYRDHVKHLGEGCRTAAELHRELVAKDFDMSYNAVRL